ncbi:hypothetical protein L0U85_09935 [Glycomyces sp. L485]|nr:hypothetical protein [Glycomyces sp. L485]MCH7231169.1 hypothetical protein [Glycomyces sp. L485]
MPKQQRKTDAEIAAGFHIATRDGKTCQECFMAWPCPTAKENQEQR